MACRNEIVDSVIEDYDSFCWRADNTMCEVQLSATRASAARSTSTGKVTACGTAATLMTSGLVPAPASPRPLLPADGE